MRVALLVLTDRLGILSPDVDDSHGKMLRIHHEGDVDIAESLAPDGSAHEVWRGP